MAVAVAIDQLISDNEVTTSAKTRGRIQGLRQVLKMIDEMTGASTDGY